MINQMKQRACATISSLPCLLTRQAISNTKLSAGVHLSLREVHIAVSEDVICDELSPLP